MLSVATPSHRQHVRRPVATEADAGVVGVDRVGDVTTVLMPSPRSMPLSCQTNSPGEKSRNRLVT